MDDFYQAGIEAFTAEDYENAKTSFMEASNHPASEALALYHLTRVNFKVEMVNSRNELNKISQTIKNGLDFLNRVSHSFQTNESFFPGNLELLNNYMSAFSLVEAQSHKIHLSIHSIYQNTVLGFRKALEKCNEKEVELYQLIVSNLQDCLLEHSFYFVRLKQEEKAEQILKEVIQSNPSNIRALYAIGDILFRQNRYPEARGYFSLIFDHNPQNSLIGITWLNIANCHRLEKSFVEAKIALEAAKPMVSEEVFLQEKAKLTQSISQLALIKAPQAHWLPHQPKILEKKEKSRDFVFQ